MTETREELIETRRGALTARITGDDQAPPILLVHGFPDSPHTFDDLAATLSAAGYCCVAPYLPGYGATALPTGSLRTRLSDVTDSLAALAASVGRGAPVPYVGHDWGAVFGYLLAARHGGTLDRMLVAAVPPPATLVRALSLGQLRRSAYMGAFQVPVFPDRAVADPRGRLVRALWQRWSPGWRFREADIAPAIAALAAPGAASRALSYYRGIGPGLTTDAAGRRAALAPIEVPTLIVAGATDGCMAPCGFRGAADAGPGVRGLVTVAGAGHFMHREQPERFAELCRDFLSAPSSRGAARV
ncbi:MAG: alpha/beta hydrolase [Myxococcales bacterium]|nr:alpha/beta hydrolase [Myxococcales bacterium]MCB9521352.1 alpha/beta hydrolase [Myxococcales bacterium]